MAERDYYVEVCSACLCASCWHGEFMCQVSDNAGTRKMKASELRRMGLENEDRFSRERLMLVCGSVEECAV